MIEVEVRECIDAQGRSPYARWFDTLDARTAAKVATALVRMEQGNLSNAKGVGVKKRQRRDIAAAQDLWREYKRRKRQET